MKKIFLALAFIFFLPSDAKAQVTCPPGYIAVATIRSRATSLVHQVMCSDDNGNILFPAVMTGSFSSGVSPLAFGAKFDVKFIVDAGFTNGSQTVTCPFNDCGFTLADIGKIVFGTLGTVSAFNLNGSLVVPQGVITSINNANSVQVSVASTATCVSSSTQICGFAWGSQDDAPAINSAMVQAWNQNGKCGTVVLPAGNFFFGSAFLSEPATSYSSACGGVGFGGVQGQDLNQTGPEVYGQGPNNTVGIPLPSFNFASCTNGFASQSCNLATPNLEAHDFGTNGLGQNLASSPHTNALFELGGQTGPCTGSTGYNLTFANWAAQSAGTVGLRLGSGACGDPYYANIVSELNGATNCDYEVSSTIMTISFVACFGSSAQTLTVNGTGVINETGSYITGFLGGSGPVINVTGTVAPFTFNSYGDNISCANVANTCNALQISNTATGDFNIYGSALNTQASGGTMISAFSSNPFRIHFHGGKIITNAASKTINTTAGNDIFDEQQMQITLGGVANTISGNVYGSASVTGSPCVAGNWALTSGWGTSTIASVTTGGDSHRCQVVITGAAGAASPVLTWTFPKAYQLIPPGSCQISFNGTLTGESTGAPTLTNVAFTFTGTPSAQTYRLDASCGP